MKKYGIKYKSAFYACLFFIIACTSCKDKIEEPAAEIKNQEGVIIEKNILWQADVSETGLVWPSLSPALFENTIIVAGNTNEDKDMLISLDINSGEEIWRWTEFLTDNHIAGINNAEYDFNQVGNTLILQSEVDFYGLNVENGETIWKEKRSGAGFLGGVQIVGNYYYNSFSFYKDSVLVPTLIKGDIYSSQFIKVLEPPINAIQYFQSFYGLMGQPYLYMDNGNLNALLTISENVDVYSSTAFNYITSYNISLDQYTLKKIQLGDTSKLLFSQRPVMHKNIIIVNPDEVLYGIDKHSGEIIWQRTDFKNEGSGVFKYQIYNDVLFAVNELGLTDRVIAIDPLTGNTLWEDLGRGNSTHSLHFLNDIMYFTSRSDGKLYAYDTENGDLLWRLNSPDVENFQGFGGLRAIPGKDGEKGKIVVCSYLNAYCYEAER